MFSEIQNTTIISKKIVHSKPGRRKIHSTVKFLVHINALPKEYCTQLHRSQLSRYKNHFNFQEYFGHDLWEAETQAINQIKQVYQYETDRKIVSACLEITEAMRNAFITAKRYKSTLRKNYEKIVEVVQRFKDVVSVEKFASLLHISESTLRNWIREIRVRCSDSLINICRKLHPNQLLRSEIESIKKLLENKKLMFWPLRSLYYYGLKENMVSMALSTWYKYVRLLKVKRQKPISLKKYGESIRAAKPNEYWHADVMYYRAKDGTLNYLYTVMDNFSHYPLAVKASSQLSGKVRTETFKEALRVALRIHPYIETINLVVDGGSENFNGSVNEFLTNLDKIEIKRIRALRDVSFSNSTVEALNRTMRCNYFNQLPIKDFSDFEKAAHFAKWDFGENRPHGKFKGLTPLEMYSDKEAIERVSYALQIANARKDRTKINQRYKCSSCGWH